MEKKSKLSQKGQTLISLLFFTVIAIAVTTVIFIILSNSLQSLTKYSEATTALNIAESGAENALLRLVRNPRYSGETLTVDEGQAFIQVTSDGQIIITSTGKIRDTIRKIQLEIIYNEGVYNVVSWKEID